MRKFVLCFLFLQHLSLSAQPGFAWVNQLGGPDNDYPGSIACDKAGNVYVTGIFIDTLDFDPGPGSFYLYPVPSSTYWQMFVTKTDPSGNLIWAKHLGNGSPVSICIDPADQIYICTSRAGGKFIDKMDPAGNVIWTKNISTSNLYTVEEMTVHQSIYVTGHFTDSIDCDPGPGTWSLIGGSYYESAFICRFDTACNFSWAGMFGGPLAGVNAYAIAADMNDDVYLTGHFSGNIDFDPGPASFILSSAGPDAFITKLDDTGNLKWAKQFTGGPDGYSRGISITADKDGNTYSTGLFNGPVDFDPGAGTHWLSSEGYMDAYVSKLDTHGNFLWTEGIGSPGIDEGISIRMLSNGAPVILGTFQGSIDFDPGPDTFLLTHYSYNNDLFILQLDPDGAFVCAGQLARGAGHNWGWMALHGSDKIYVTGSLELTEDFDPGAGTAYLSTAGLDDIFTCRLDACSNITSINEIQEGSFQLYPNPSQGFVTVGLKEAASICVYAPAGDCILQMKAAAGNQAIDLREQAKGLYFIEIRTKDEKLLRKIVLH